MQSAIKILFETIFNGKPLFSSQLDLAHSLLTDPNSKYHVPDSELELYTKTLNRLKSYISQLLSVSVSRSISEDFRDSLPIVITSRLKGTYVDVTKLVDEILESIKEKNLAIGKSELKSSLIGQFVYDLQNANYIVVITSRPLEIEAPDKEGLPTLRHLLFSDLIARIYDKEKKLKSYRFNFPNESFCYLFWRGLKRILIRQIKTVSSPELFESLHSKFKLETNMESVLKYQESLTDEQIEMIVDEILLRLNSERYLLVFTTTAPIYGLPTIALDPSDTKNNKIYSILDNEKMTLFKFPENETLLWRLFAWDPLKSKKYAGQPIIYSHDSI